MTDTRLDDARVHFERLAAVVDPQVLVSALDELVADRSCVDAIERAVADVAFFQTKHWADVLDLGLYRVTLYALTRALRPAVFIETGVLHGLTSAFILAALRKNDHGSLVSIDLPSYFENGPVNQDGFTDTLPPGKEPGWTVCDEYRRRWQLVLGRSLDVLPQVLDRTGSICIFLHDSEHTVATMKGEFELAWPRLRDGGVLVADNIDTNAAFLEFCARVQRTPVLFPEEYSDRLLARPRFGLITK